eukprot:CAMPEP_0195508568 /NCGR_PEP_ID=MMETSP0794_2-20130614/1738_1 /TAXON_ID=515487 /ORGANISM="Stephanopyxis turris, Strain CCMP 815" /LENGTH=291 /DNA_ID=CAMNT_0040635561 /DNA_START=18 /DNA_END=893 /DNA_ORIENTATION=-
MTIQYNEFAMAASAPPAPTTENDGNPKYGEYRSVPSVEAANGNLPLQSRQHQIPTVQTTSYGHAAAPNAQFNPSSNFDMYAAKPTQSSIPTVQDESRKITKVSLASSFNQHIDDDLFPQQMSQSLVPKEDTVPSLIAASSGSTTGSHFSSATLSSNQMATAINKEEGRQEEVNQQLSLYEQPQQKIPTTTSTTMITTDRASQNYLIPPVEDPVAKMKRRRARNRVRVMASASGGVLLGGVLLGPAGMILGGYGAALITHAASKRGERKKDERVAKEQLRRAPKPHNNGVFA